MNLSVMGKIITAISQGWHYRQQLHDICQNRAIATILDMTPPQLKQQGIKAVLLDFDGVLSYHGGIAPLPDVETWLQQCVQCFGSKRVFLLTNCLFPQRFHYFQQKYPSIVILHPKQAKPSPDGIYQALHISQIPAEQMLLFDDRLLTGMLAAVQSNIQTFYVTQPFRDFKHKFMAECFFSSIRYLEHKLFD